MTYRVVTFIHISATTGGVAVSRLAPALIRSNCVLANRIVLTYVRLLALIFVDAVSTVGTIELVACRAATIKGALCIPAKAITWETRTGRCSTLIDIHTFLNGNISGIAWNATAMKTSIGINACFTLIKAIRFTGAFIDVDTMGGLVSKSIIWS